MIIGGFYITLTVLPTTVLHCNKMTCYFDNCICYQKCNCDMVLWDDALLAPCDSHLGAMWAMQPLWSTATIEFCPQYKDPCHCKTDWLP